MRAVNHDVNSRAQHKRETMMIIWETENMPLLSWTGCWTALNWLFVHRVYSTKIGMKSLLGDEIEKIPLMEMSQQSWDWLVTSSISLPFPFPCSAATVEKEESPPHPSFPHLPPIKTPHIGRRRRRRRRNPKRGVDRFATMAKKYFASGKRVYLSAVSPKNAMPLEEGGEKLGRNQRGFPKTNGKYWFRQEWSHFKKSRFLTPHSIFTLTQRSKKKINL